MPPRHDHRRPLLAFAVLFVVAMLVLGNGLRARAQGGSLSAAFRLAHEVVLVAAPRSAPEPVAAKRPAPGVLPASLRVPAAVASGGQRAAAAGPRGRRTPGRVDHPATARGGSGAGHGARSGDHPGSAPRAHEGGARPARHVHGSRPHPGHGR